MLRYLTDSQNDFTCSKVSSRVSIAEPEMRLIKVYPHRTYQTIIGFGAAFTEASAYVYAHMDQQARRRFIDLCFGPSGNRYSLCRTTIQSCDFSLGPRAYLDSRDASLAGFSIEGDKAYVLPLLKDACAAADELEFLASPWSPPAWAKTNRTMLRGGKLKLRDYTLWAKMIVRYLQDYREEGVNIRRITLQNEPDATQSWESCRFNPHQEARLAKAVKAQLKRAGLGDVKVLIWDHNKQGMFDRAAACLSDRRAARAIDGVAFHWYSGDHFEAVEATRELIGARELIFTEGCDSYSAGDVQREIPHAEHYAHELIGDLRAGAQGAIDWNILLDEQGGPNHVGNFCDAPIMYNFEKSELNVRKPFVYLGHFSRFVRPNAIRTLCTSYTADLEACSFENEDGSSSLIVLNRTDRDREFDLVIERGVVSEHVLYRTGVPAHSIATYVW